MIYIKTGNTKIDNFLKRVLSLFLFWRCRMDENCKDCIYIQKVYTEMGAVKEDVKELKETVKSQGTDIISLKENQAETKIYVKQIFERIDDLKVMFKSGTSDTNDKWLKVVMELIKVIGIVAGIVAGVKVLGN